MPLWKLGRLVDFLIAVGRTCCTGWQTRRTPCATAASPCCRSCCTLSELAACSSAAAAAAPAGSPAAGGLLYCRRRCRCLLLGLPAGSCTAAAAAAAARVAITRRVRCRDAWRAQRARSPNAAAHDDGSSVPFPPGHNKTPELRRRRRLGRQTAWPVARRRRRRRHSRRVKCRDAWPNAAAHDDGPAVPFPPGHDETPGRGRRRGRRGLGRRTGWAIARRQRGSGNAPGGGREAATARSCNNSLSLSIAMATVSVSSSSGSMGQQRPLWRRHGGPSSRRSQEPSQSATPSSRPSRPERYES
jgi:hypothetical protein